MAVAKACGPVRGLALLDDLDHRFQLGRDPLIRHRERTVRAHLLQMTGDTIGAARLYREATSLTGNLIEQRYLLDTADLLG
ncbi:hypothetical protein [Herbidospora sp. RD11066]